MDVFTIAVWVLTAGFLVFSLSKDKEKTKEAVKKALGMGKGMLLSILSIIFAIGLLLTIFTPEAIAEFVETEIIFNKVKEMNIDYSQGYFFSEPKLDIPESL